jgi:hypothetical protein
VLAEQNFTEQLARNAARVAIVEAPRQRTGVRDIESGIAHENFNRGLSRMNADRKIRA